MLRPLLRLRPLPASVALVSMAVGAMVILLVTALTFIPLLVGAAVVTAWIAALLLFGWAGIEALAALERWVESDPRFKR